MRLGDDYHGIETMTKSDIEFSDTLAALYSGPWEDCLNLKRVLLRSVRATQLTLDNYREVLSHAWKEFDAIFRGHEQPETDTQCIVAGFIEGEPRIIRIQKGGVDTFPFYAAIGIGAYHADTILCWRGITQHNSLEQILYFLYEARKFGGLCKDVGGTNIMQILTLDAENMLQVDIVLGSGLNVLEGWFQKLGPQKVGYDISIPEEYIVRIKPGCADQ